MPLVTVKLAEGVFTEKQKHDMAAGSPTCWSPAKDLRASAAMDSSGQAVPEDDGCICLG
jgi:hypothetical protein